MMRDPWIAVSLWLAFLIAIWTVCTLGQIAWSHHWIEADGRLADVLARLLDRLVRELDHKSLVRRAPGRRHGCVRSNAPGCPPPRPGSGRQRSDRRHAHRRTLGTSALGHATMAA